MIPREQIELKRCPFCGSTDVRINYIRDGRFVIRDGCFVKCSACCACSAPAFHSPQELSAAEQRAISKWNRRALSPDRDALLREWKDAITGSVQAWIVEGAVSCGNPRASGIAVAKAITLLKVKTDAALAEHAAPQESRSNNADRAAGQSPAGAAPDTEGRGGMKNDEAAAFTHEHFAAWRAYERVRAGGRFNMFDPRARRLTGLSAEQYSFVMKNYSELRDAIIAEKIKP